MSKLKTLINMLKHDKSQIKIALYNNIVHTGITNFFNDEAYLKLTYKINFGKRLNLENPTSFNEKLQWLKLYDKNEKYINMVDKILVKNYVSDKLGKNIIIPTLGIYDKFEDIDFKSLPNKFVIKCNHDSGSIVICKDKNNFNVNKAKKIITKKLKYKSFYWGREWPYKNVKPKIIIEKYMEDKKYSTMRDYKFFCFNGEPKIMYISEGLENHNTASMSFFDMDFKLINCKRKDYKLLDYTPEKPKTFEKMKEFASILSKDIPHVRVDFYEIDGKLYFGELTFFTCSGLIPFESEEWNKILGSWIDLSLVDKNEK